MDLCRFKCLCFRPHPVDEVHGIWDGTPPFILWSKGEYTEDIPATKYGMEGGMK